MSQNQSPFAALQFFGQVDIDSRSGDMTVALKETDGATVFTRVLHPARGLQ